MLIGSIVLAGGKSERMQSPKAELLWGDGSLLFDRVEAMLACSYPVVVVRRLADQALPPINTEAETTVDAIPDGGPLVGIRSGLEHVADRCDAAVAIGCDFPFFTGDTLHWLNEQLGDHAGVVPMNGDTPQPLCGLYRVSLLDELKRAIEGGKREAKAMLELSGVVTIDTATVDAYDKERRFLHNINTQEEYEQALKWKS